MLQKMIKSCQPIPYFIVRQIEPLSIPDLTIGDSLVSLGLQQMDERKLITRIDKFIFYVFCSGQINITVARNGINTWFRLLLRSHVGHGEGRRNSTPSVKERGPRPTDLTIYRSATS